MDGVINKQRRETRGEQEMKKRKREREEKYRSSFFDMLLTTVKKSYLILWLNVWQFQSFSYVVHDFVLADILYVNHNLID